MTRAIKTRTEGRLRLLAAPAGEPATGSAGSSGLVSDRDAIAAIGEVLAAAAAGDLEPRVGQLEAREELSQLANQVDSLLDVIDAFVRESGTALVAAAEGRYHRQVLTRGMPGAFQHAAERINEGQAQMKRGADELAERDAAQEEIASAAKDVSTQLAGAATELSASADSLATSANTAVTQTDHALTTMGRLAETSQQIDHAAQLISRVAAQTRLLALNAAIEAARAGQAGKGFEVVAKEVKDLAEETTRSSQQIEVQVQAARGAADAAGLAIAAISEVIREVDSHVAGIADAAGGRGGLSYLAETLHEQIGRFGEP